MLRLSPTGVTHRGLVRAHNEDSGFFSPDLALVADGVGGGAAGEVASATAAYAVAATVMNHRTEDPSAVLAAGIRSAQEQVQAGVVADPSRSGMATTLTAVLTNGERFAVAHIGDSRGYVWREEELIRITRDHTYVAALVDDGQLSDDEAAVHPWRNVVLRSVNGDAEERADVLPLALRIGDRVLLGSDGLTDLVEEGEIADVLDRYPDDPACVTLRDLALTRGGRDNITVVAATVVEGGPVRPDGRWLGAAMDPGNVVDPTAIQVSLPA